MRALFCIILFLTFFSAQAQSPKAVNDYVEKYRKVAIEEMKLTGIPASITLAQGIHESGCGCSKLAINSNNHFGIKCHVEWTGAVYHHDDDQLQECFRVYNNPEESFKDHSDFLRSRPRYASLFNLANTDYKGWAKGLKAAGYATNPKYPEIIIKLVEDYKLSQYDKGIEKPDPATVLVTDAKALKPATQTAQVIEIPKPKPSQQSPVTATASTETVKPKVETPTAVEVQKPKPAPITAAASTIPAETKAKATAPISIPAVKEADISKAQLDERLINGIKAVVYKANTPVASIAKKYNLTVNEIYSYNDMLPNVKFREGEYIYLEKKKTETTYYQYELAEGETMRDVAQKFGIQLLELYKRNGISMDCEPIAGEIIVLRGNREVPIKFHVIDRSGVRRSSAESINPADGKYHKVNDSDTLYSIARQYNMQVDDLIRLNGLKDNDIKIGQTLLVSSL